ncbi:MAG: SxtJ family membrane protein [Planctomycetota bacterium]|nr:SxtJ family membrane protein [Planctomycetota bacterium]MDA1212495.1 SxtJ family membrane protein [Planctomycetota bacterium]
MAVMNVNWNPPKKMLQQFCVLLTIFGTLFAGVAYAKTGDPTVSLSIFVVALFLSVTGYFVPPFGRIVYVGMMIVTYPIGWTLSHLLLGGIFYLVITPLAIMMKLFGYDPMKRSIDKSAATYWQKRTPATSSKRYFQQY